MLEFTIEKALEGDIDTNDHYLYLYRDGSTVLYIGRSSSPLQRLYEHLGKGDFRDIPSHVGKTIIDNLPLSLSWSLLLLTLADCEPLVRLHRRRPTLAARGLMSRAHALGRRGETLAAWLVRLRGGDLSLPPYLLQPLSGSMPAGAAMGRIYGYLDKEPGIDQSAVLDVEVPRTGEDDLRSRRGHPELADDRRQA